jgi:hypothetical protein
MGNDKPRGIHLASANAEIFDSVGDLKVKLCQLDFV